MSKNSNDFRVVSVYKKRRLCIVVFFLFLSLTSLFLSITFGIKYIDKKNNFMFSARENAQHKILTTADTLSTFIKTLKNITLSLTSELEKNKLSKKAVETFLTQKPIEVANFGIKVKPEFSPTGKYWAPCVSQRGGRDLLEDRSFIFGTNNSVVNWDHELLVHDTFSTDIDDDILIEYRRVFYHENVKTGTRIPAGIVFASQNRKYFRHLLTTLFYGQAGYWFIIDKNKGTVLIYPKKNYEDNKITLLQLAEQRNTPELKVLYERVQDEKAGYFKYNNEITGAPSWLYFRSIPLTDWVLCGVFDRSDILLPPKQEKRDIINLFLFFLFFIIFLSVAFILNNKATIRNLWLISTLFSVGFTLIIGLVWYTSMYYPIIQETGNLIRDKIDLYKKLEEVKDKGNRFQKFSPEKKKKDLLSDNDTNKEALPKKLLDYLTFHYHARLNAETNNNPKSNKKSDYAVIPTGIFINHMNYINRNQLEIGFFLWQRYMKALHGTIKHDIILPKAAGPEIKMLYKREVDGVEIILWEVKCVLDQLADFTNYPFDINAIRLKIWPNEFDKKIILVPDFSAYNTVNPSFLPGLANKTFLVGFNPIKSFFSFREGTYNTNFGIYNYGEFGVYEQLDKASVPELYFNIIPQRQMLDIFIADLTPIIIIAFLIFYLFITIEIHSYTMFRSSATVFFGLLLAHMRFRSKVPSNQFVYFDCLYLVLYVMILLLTLLSIINLVFAKGSQHKKNLILQLLYWPLVLGSILYFTFLFLY